MASPEKEAVNPPETLPPEFFEKQEAPETLPADFKFEQAPAKPTATINAAPERGVSGWLEDAQRDLREGGGRTVVGRVLGGMQGHGDKGYSGMQSGVSPDTAEFMGSVPLGGMKMAEGVNDVAHGSPWQGAKKVLGGALQASSIPLSFMAPEVAEVAEGALPSAVRAGRTIGEIREAAKGVPVPLKMAGPQVERFHELTEAGGKTSRPFTQLYDKMQGGQTMAFPQAHDFYGNIGDVTSPSTLEKLMGRGMRPKMLRTGVMARQGLKQDLTDSLNSIGRAQDFVDAQREYANAMRLRKVMRAGGLLAAGEAARRSGLLGNWIHRAALQQ